MKEMAVLYIVDGRKKDISNAATKKYNVQYNPAEITVNAGEPIKKTKKNKRYKIGTSKGHKAAEYEEEHYSIKVSIPLIFDSTQKYEKGIEESVSTEVEGFIAMLRNPNIRYLMFSWGALCYSGELVSMSGQYTMFTESGIPVRASISLTIKCQDYDNNNQWMGMYSQAFSGGMNASKGRTVKNGLNKALLKISKVSYNASSKSITPDKNSLYTMEVEYNPSSISISSGVSLRNDNVQSDENDINQERNPSSDISFQLIFDSTISDKTDVAVITNGLLSLMTDKTMTEMEFCWGDMSFKGHLSGIQAKFTMFTEAGIPMRSTVDISLGRENGDDTYWNNAFEKLVEKKYGSI